ncbi:MAG: ATP-binding cassette domain-containing protein [Alphaproteobacteria bacterium]|nr:ATP-binding cassette domain-containing protein [Alphaproteobacteria bacterium]
MDRKPEEPEDDDEFDDVDDDSDESEDDESDPSEAERLNFTFADARASIAAFGRFLAPYLLRRPRALALLAACVAVEAAFNVAFPLSLKYLVDSVFDEERWELLVLILAVLGGLGALAAATMVAGEWLNARIGAEAMARMRQDLFDRIQRVSLGYIDRTQSGRIMSRLSNDVGAIDEVVMHAVDWGVLPFVELLGAVALLFWLSPMMAVISMAVFPLTLLGPRLVAPRAVAAGYSLKRSLADALATAGEGIAGQKLVRAFALQRRIRRWYAGRNLEVRRAARRVRFLDALLERSASIGVLILHLVVFGIGAVLTFEEYITVGTFIAFEAVFWELSYNTVHVAQFLPEVVAGAAALRHIEEFRTAPEAPRDAADAAVPAPFRTEIRFENVSFAYDDGNGGVRDVSLVIPAGSRAAIVGESGSGKTTLLMLLLGLHRPNAGRILIDGADMAMLDGDAVRAMMGVVFQDTILFGTSIRENIRLGRPSASDTDIVAAAKGAGVHRFIKSLPQRYDTLVGERGDTLSQGQRQRVGIARAIIRNPAILLLDEATSALDTLTRKEIQTTLAKVTRDRTIVSIAHDLQSVSAYDRIFVMSEGRLVQTGTHAELVAIDGPYRRLWRQSAD